MNGGIYYFNKKIFKYFQKKNQLKMKINKLIMQKKILRLIRQILLTKGLLKN